MTELQKTELEMLKEFICICEELNLTYYLVCGSALGAVKYQGFIPWDDDLDVALPRKDYRIFCEKAQQMLPKHLFLQNHITDPDYPYVFSKIRNSNTTFIESGLSKRNINHGIYMDVFPLDGYPQDEKKIRFLENAKRNYQLSILCCLNTNQTWKTKVIAFLGKLLQMDKKSAASVRKIEKIISQYPTEDSILWCNHGNWQGTLEYAQREQYGNGIFMSFEGLKVRVPEQYDAYLTQKYANWRDDLPDEQKKGHHFHDVCDCNRPYTDYIHNDITT